MAEKHFVPRANPIQSAAEAQHEVDALASSWHNETYLILRIVVYCAVVLEKILAKVEPLR